MIAGFAPKTYQSQVLESITAYFESCHEQRSPSLAFTATTEQLWGRGLAYNPLSGFSSDMPYFCLRVPTGGGKTWLAAKSVATRQAFQVEDEECRKVYQSSGALMHHFENLAAAQRNALLGDGEGVEQVKPYSLANVLRLHRPFVSVDEAHNSRTELAFDMLSSGCTPS